MAKRKTVSRLDHFYKKVKRWAMGLTGVSILGLGGIFVYAGNIGKTDVVFRRLWNTVVYSAGFSQLKQDDFGNLKVHGLVSVYDGDTFTCDIDGLHPIVGERIGIRIRGIDTPEMTDDRPDIKRKAIAARDHLRQRLVTAEEILLKNVARDKYFRVLADIWVDGISIQRELIAKGLAKPYDGGTKSSW